MGHDVLKVESLSCQRLRHILVLDKAIWQSTQLVVGAWGIYCIAPEAADFYRFSGGLLSITQYMRLQISEEEVGEMLRIHGNIANVSGQLTEAKLSTTRLLCLRSARRDEIFKGHGTPRFPAAARLTALLDWQLGWQLHAHRKWICSWIWRWTWWTWLWQWGLRQWRCRREVRCCRSITRVDDIVAQSKMITKR